jgi:hypothetical protein
MANYENIVWKNEAKEETIRNNFINSLTFGLFDWGNINLPTEITLDTIQKLFGTYDTENEEEWMQAYNFLSYVNSLDIYRISHLSTYPTFDAGTDYLTDVDGISHAMAFVRNVTSGNKCTWNESDNGSDLILKLNDQSIPTNEPTFASDQVLFIYAKYAGGYGNNIGIAIATYLDDLTTTYIFNNDYILDVTDASSFSVGNTITGDTSGATGTITAIKNNAIYVSLTTNTEFDSTETINTATTTIQSVTDPDQIDNNPLFFDIVGRQLDYNEICIVETLDNNIVNSHIVSLDSDDTDKLYIENIESDYIEIILNPSYTPVVSTDNLATMQSKLPESLPNFKLAFGDSGFNYIELNDYLEQLENLKDEHFTDMNIIFSEVQDYRVQEKVVEVVDARSNTFAILNKNAKLPGSVSPLLITNDDIYIVTNDGDFIKITI